MKRILILGSEGFIGSHLVEYFLNRNWEVMGADLIETTNHAIAYHKIQDQEVGYEKLVQSFQFDCCVNAAGNGDVNFSVKNPYNDFRSNTLMTIRLLEAIRKYAPRCKYIHISSAAVYGNPVKLPINEHDVINPISPYGWHKFLAEESCKEYNEVYGIECAIIRPFSVYGPGLKKQLLWDVYVRSKEANGPLELWGTGAETRDFIYIDDLTKAVELILERSEMKASIYNLASGEMTAIADLVPMLLKALGKPSAVYFNGNVRKGNPNQWKADISKIKELGFEPAVDLKTGISKLADWMRHLS
jgi:nucleoside-diphosphate-sugar epimerase